MKIAQLSVFVENRPGHLAAPIQTLAAAGINILTLSLADTQQYGVLRLIIRDWQRARQVLEEAGMMVRVTEVLAVEVPDRPGGLAEVLRATGQAGLNIEYMYAFTTRVAERAVLVFRFADPDAAIAALAQSEVNTVGQVELYDRLERHV